MLKENEISLEQLRKMLHISKRKAAWMLQSGVIPCRMRNTPTHKYAVRIEDVEIYLEKSPCEKRNEIPIGIFNAHPTASAAIDLPELCLTLRGEERERYIEHIERSLKRAPDRLTIADAMRFTKYSDTYIYKLIRRGKILGVMISGTYYLPKASLIEFFASDDGFMIRHKSKWHKAVIQRFIEKQTESK